MLGGRNLSSTLSASFPSSLTRWERAAAQDAVYGTLRHLGALRNYLAQLLHQPTPQPHLECLLLVALFQLQFSRVAPHAVVQHAVEAAAALGAPRARGLVNAVLRNFLRQRDDIVLRATASEEGRYSYPAWWIDRIRVQHPSNWSSLLGAGNEHPPMSLRVNQRQISTSDYLAALREAEIDARLAGPSAVMLTLPHPVSDLPGFEAGWVSVQDVGAQLAAPFLDAGSGMRVLDACAAPGGKAGHLLELADLELLALDKDGTRLLRMRENLARLGLSAQVIEGDAANPRAWWDGQTFDRILADVPCSASGVVRRHPDVKWLRRESDLPQFAAQQAAILDALWQTLARGGKLLYSTCSVFRDENQDQVTRFLDRHSDARPLTLPGLPPDGMLLPDNNHDGFFYALFHKD